MSKCEWLILESKFNERLSISGIWSSKVTSTTERSNEDSSWTKVSSTATENFATTTIRSRHQQCKYLRKQNRNESLVNINFVYCRVSPSTWIHSTVQFWPKSIKYSYNWMSLMSHAGNDLFAICTRIQPNIVRTVISYRQNWVGKNEFCNTKLSPHKKKEPFGEQFRY